MGCPDLFDFQDLAYFILYYILLLIVREAMRS